MKRIKFTPLQISIHILGLAALGRVLWELYFDTSAINPIQSATQLAGRLALIFLIASLACTPINTLFGYRQVVKVRRPLGLYAFIIAATHFLIFNVVDYGLDWTLLQIEYFERRYIFVGMAAFFVLLALAFTSYKWWMKKLGKNWKRLHRLVYFAAPLVTLHYAWAKKGDIFRLQGDILLPLAVGIIITVLLVLRIPRVRSWASNLRARSGWRLSTRTL